MYINPDWRILTIGDGDLSFSESLLTHYQPRLLEASVYDSEVVLSEKYSKNSLRTLKARGVNVHTRVDVTNPDSLRQLNKAFDVVIFQFPLIPPFASGQEFRAKSAQGSTNTLNRQLLRLFLIHSFEYLLDPKGIQLCVITSKDVKPYCEWNLEGSLNRGIDVPFLGSMRFELDHFPGYRIRNVDRDTVIPDTRGMSYVWGPRAPADLAPKLAYSSYLGPDHCAMCRAGPFGSEDDRSMHYHSTRHRKMQRYEDQWTEAIG